VEFRMNNNPEFVMKLLKKQDKENWLQPLIEKEIAGIIKPINQAFDWCILMTVFPFAAQMLIERTILHKFYSSRQW
jgi:hypothetical protein